MNNMILVLFFCFASVTIVTAYSIVNPIQHQSFPFSSSTQRLAARNIIQQTAMKRRLNHGDPRPIPKESGQVCTVNGSIPFENEMTIGIISTYTKDIDCLWNIQFNYTRTKFVTLILSDIFLVPQRDHLTIIAGNNKVPISGDTFGPQAIRLPITQNANIVSIDVASSAESKSIPRHVKASVHIMAFDSTDDMCFKNCSNHGFCGGGLCMCEKGWIGADCAIACPIIKPGIKKQVYNVSHGQWSYYRVDVDRADSNILIEFLDKGNASSDAYLAVGLSPPTLNPVSSLGVDWYSFFFDNTDVHYIRMIIPDPTILFIGITNHHMRGSVDSVVEGSLIVRTVPKKELKLKNLGLRKSPCIGNCFGNGKCDFKTGQCICKEGYAGSHASAERSCQFKIRNVQIDRIVPSKLRIGNWDYYKFTIDERQAGNRRIVVNFDQIVTSLGKGLCVIRKGSVPELQHGILPMYSGFDFDFGDFDGFGTNGGLRQSIMIDPTNLTAGDYYIGVYNTWGYSGLYDTGSNEDSHGTLQYNLYVNIYAYGRPCPTAPHSATAFCSGFTCDFNTGVCECPIHRVGKNCAQTAYTLVEGTPTTGHLEIGKHKYFYFPVTQNMVKDGSNLVVTMSVKNESYSSAALITQYNDIPFEKGSNIGKAVTMQDLKIVDHDFEASISRAKVHRILLDREELKAGNWYFKVQNAVVAYQALQYTLEVVVSINVECVRGHNGQICSGRGKCLSLLGRCECTPGFTKDDCSAFGVFPWPHHKLAHFKYSPDPILPDIPINSWSYYSVPVGCPNQMLDLSLSVWNNGSAPLLSVRDHRLPLAMAEGSKYYDYFDGKLRAYHQRIIVGGCDQQLGNQSGPNQYQGCMVQPMVPFGSLWAIGSPEPGMYYFGVYNDPTYATAPITNYSISASVIGGCGNENQCAPGFVGKDCLKVCPGIQLAQHYSHTPMGDGSPCNNNGECSAVGGKAQCTCKDDFFGEACQHTCPTTAKGDVCSNNGRCEWSKSALLPVCKCNKGTTGVDCSAGCPSADDGTVCGNNGKCMSRKGRSVCMCKAGYVGVSCTLACPTNGGVVCSGNGQCVRATVKENQESAVCTCQSEYAGADCSKQLQTKLSSSEGAPAAVTVETNITPSWVLPVVIAAAVLLIVSLSMMCYYYKAWKQRGQQLLARNRTNSDEDCEVKKKIPDQLNGGNQFQVVGVRGDGQDLEGLGKGLGIGDLGDLGIGGLGIGGLGGDEGQDAEALQSLVNTSV